MEPRLCYIGPAIGPGLGGQAVMYKLLQGYPAEQLMLVQTPLEDATGDSLPAAQVINLPLPRGSRGQRRRTLIELSLSFAAGIWFQCLSRRLRKFRPELIVSVMHGWACALAATAARELGVPLHLIIHDTADAALSAPRFLRDWRQERWKTMCQIAQSRICVSPFMAEEVQRLTKSRTDILYPGLAPNPRQPVLRSSEDRHRSGSITVAFVGRIHAGFDPVLLELASALATRGHRLVLHSPQADGFIRSSRPPATINGGVLGLTSVTAKLQTTADICFLPMSFRPQDEANTRLSFPSKLVEYCAAAKPVLVCAPAYSSIVTWARTQPRFALIVTLPNRAELEEAVSRLESPELRKSLGQTAANLAERLFSHEATYSHFLKIILRP